MSETIKEVVEMNPKKKKKKKSAAKTSPTPKKKHHKKGRAANPKKTHRRRRKKNPSVDVKGTVEAFIGGGIGYVAGQTAATLVSGKVANEWGKIAAKVALGAGLPLAGSVLVGAKMPSLGKGMAGAGGALAAGHAIGAVGNLGKTPNETLQKSGLMLGGADDVFERGGAYFRRMADGSTQKLIGVAQQPVQLQLDDGSTAAGTLLGETPDGGSYVVVDDQGQTHVLPGATMGELVVDESKGMGELVINDGLAGDDDEDAPFSE